jgi:hypothetical protein
MDYLPLKAHNKEVIKVSKETTQMNTINLNGEDALKVAERIGGTLILWNITDDTAMIVGGDLSMLEVA